MTRRGAACAGCCLVALTMALLPYVAARGFHGTWVFLPSQDEVTYLMMSRPAIAGHAELRDPFAGAWEHVPAISAWTLFVPPAWLAGRLGIPLKYLGLCWRVVGAMLFALALYALLSRFAGRGPHAIWWTTSMVVLCLTDAGFLGRPLVDSVALLRHLIAGTTPLLHADAIGQYRAVSPIMNLPFVIALAAVVAAEGGLVRRALAGGFCLGVTILLYFYFWTAAIAALVVFAAALAVRSVVRRRGVRSMAKAVALPASILLVGIVLGTPQLVRSVEQSRDPAVKATLERIGRPRVLAAGDPLRHAYVVNVWTFGALVAGGAAALAFRHRGLFFLWCLAASGYALRNVAVFTGLEFENFHWGYVAGAARYLLMLGALALLAQRARRPRVVTISLVVAAAATAAIGLTWRFVEARTAPESVALTRAAAELETIAGALASADDTGTVVAFRPASASAAMVFSDAAFFYHHYLWNSPIADEDVHARHALAAWLAGADAQRYRDDAARDFIEYSRDARWTAESVRAARVAIFDRLEAGLGAEMATRYRVRWLIVSRDTVPARGGPWIPIATTRDFTLYRASEAPAVTR